MIVICPYCDSEATLASGKDIYGPKWNYTQKKFWVCFSCKAWVGCHDTTFVPYGSLAKAPLRKLRQQVHELMDQLWKPATLKGQITGRKQMKEARNLTYAWMAAELGIEPEECHIGMFNEERCERALKVLREAMGK
jgi:hypothetical protein